MQSIRRGPAVAFDQEPDLFLASFDCLIVHDYKAGKTLLTGADGRLESIREILIGCQPKPHDARPPQAVHAVSNFSRDEYIDAVSVVQERIRAGDTYQANLTQQLTIPLGETRAADIFSALRKQHPAPFASFIVRGDSTV